MGVLYVCGDQCITCRSQRSAVTVSLIPCYNLFFYCRCSGISWPPSPNFMLSYHDGLRLLKPVYKTDGSEDLLEIEHGMYPIGLCA